MTVGGAALLPYAGVTGVGFLLALLGFTLVQVLRSPSCFGGAAAWTGVVVSTLLAGVVGPGEIASGSATVAVVQGDVPGDGSDLLAHHWQVTRNHVEATLALARRVRSGSVDPDLVVWPEKSTGVGPFNDVATNEAINEAVRALQRPVLVGAMVDASDPARVLTQGIVWDPKDGSGDRYTERQPVPFGECIPFRRLLAGVSERLAPITRDMLPGTSSTPLSVAGLSVGVGIYFDVAYDDALPQQVRNGAELLVVQTSNAMFINTPHLRSSLRSPEPARSRRVEPLRLLRPTGCLGSLARTARSSPRPTPAPRSCSWTVCRLVTDSLRPSSSAPGWAICYARRR